MSKSNKDTVLLKSSVGLAHIKAPPTLLPVHMKLAQL